MKLLSAAKIILFGTASMFPGVDCGAQSLGDVARKEAERRRNLEREGVEGKVIAAPDPERVGVKGNISVFVSDRTFPAGEKARGSAAPFRRRLQKLDREIRRTEERIVLLRERLARERWSPPKKGRSAGRTAGASSQERLRAQIQDLEGKLKELRRERLELYDEGRKAGFLPGELDGKGIVP